LLIYFSYFIKLSLKDLFLSIISFSFFLRKDINILNLCMMPLIGSSNVGLVELEYMLERIIFQSASIDLLFKMNQGFYLELYLLHHY